MRLRASTAILGVLAGVAFMVFHIGFGLRGAQPGLAALMLVAESFVLARGVGLAVRFAVVQSSAPENERLQPSGGESGDVIIKVDGHNLGQVRSAIIGAIDVWGVGRVVLAGRRSDAQILELLASEYRLIVVLERTPERAVNAASRALSNELVAVVDADQVLFPDVFTWCIQVAAAHRQRDKVIGAFRIPTECHPDDAYGQMREVMSAKLGRSGAALCNSSATVYQRRALIAAKGLHDVRDGGVVATTMALYRAGTLVVALPVPVSFQQTAPTARMVSHSRLVDSASWTRVFFTRLSPILARRYSMRQRLAAVGAAVDAVAPIGAMFTYVTVVACVLSPSVPLRAPIQPLVILGGAWIIASEISRWLIFRGEMKPGDVGRGDYRAIGQVLKGIVFGLFQREPRTLLDSDGQRRVTVGISRHRLLLLALVVLDSAIVVRIAAQHTNRILTKVPRGQFLIVMAVAIFNVAVMMSAAEFLMNRRQRRSGRRAAVGFGMTVNGVAAVARDLSPDGVGFDIYSVCQPGSTVVLKFQLPDIHGRFREMALSALVRDVHQERAVRFGHSDDQALVCRVGVAFGAMSPTDRDALIEYCRSVHPYDLARAAQTTGRRRQVSSVEIAPAPKSQAGRLVRTLSWFTLIAVGVMNLPPYSLARAGPGNHTITGQVFDDRNGNGKVDGARRQLPSEHGESGIVVTAFDDGGWMVARTLTGANGTFTLNRVGVPVRVEVGPLPVGLYSSVHQADGLGLVRFVDPTRNDVTDVKIGVSRPQEHCQDSADVVASCFGGTGTAFGGTADAAGFVTATSLGSAPGSTLATSQVVSRSVTGPVFGVVHVAADDTTYLASWASANSADGLRSRTTVYRRDATGVVNPFVTLPQAAGRLAFGPGTAGLGGIAVTSDGSALLVVDIDDIRLYVVPFSTPDKSTAIAIPPVPSCAAGRSFPVALSVDGGDVYVSVTCALTAGGASTLSAAVFVQHGGTGEFDTEPVTYVDLAGAARTVTIPSDRLQRHADAQASGWYGEQKAGITVRNSTRRVQRPDGNSSAAALTALAAEERVSAGIESDVTAADEAAQFDRSTRLKARPKAALSLASAAAYSETDAAPASVQREPMVVGLAFDGDRVVLDVRDRWGRDAALIPAPSASAAGPSSSSPSTASGTAGVVTAPGASETGIASLQNHLLGSFAYVCDQAPTELGGVVWDDANGNGRHDPSELGLSGVTVRSLNADGDTTGTAVTNDRGEYVFSSVSTEAPKGNSDNVGAGVRIGKPVTIVVGGVFDNTPGGPLFSRVPSTGRALATVTPTQAGANNHGINFGFTRPRNSVGNRVGLDANSDGLLSDNEQGVAGVDVVLYEALQDAVPARPIARQTTDGQGYYQFNGIPDGLYVAAISAANFDSNRPLHGLVGSRLGVFNGATVSKLVQLDAGNDLARSRDVDFPMVPLTLSARVFNDVNRNGVFDADIEKPYVGVHVTLANTGEPFDDVTTNDLGIAVLAPNARGKFTMVTKGFGRDITQTVDIAADQSTVSVDVPFVGAVDLAAESKAMLPRSVGALAVADVQVGLANVGTVVATGGSTVVATLAGGLVVDAKNLATAGAATGATCTADAPAVVVTCVLDSAPIAPGRNRMVTLPVVIPTPVPVDSTLLKVDVVVKAAGGDGVELSDVNNAASAVIPSAKGGLSLTAKPGPPAAVVASQPFVVTFTVANNGAVPAAGGWLIAVPLDGFDPPSASGVGEQVKCELGEGVLLCSDTSGADVAPRATRDVTVTMRPRSTATNSSTVFAFLRDGAAIRDSTHPRAAVNVTYRNVDLSVESHLSPTGPVVLNDVVTISATVTNNGLDGAAAGYSVEATIPDGTTFVDVTAPLFSCTPSATSVVCTDSSTTPLPSFRSVADGRTIAMRFKVVAAVPLAQSRITVRPSPADAPEMIVAGTDSASSNNASSVMISLTPHIDLGIIVADKNPAIHAVNSRAIVDVSVFNDGDVGAKPGYAVALTVPSNLVWASGTSEVSSGFSCMLSNGVVTCVDQGSTPLAAGSARQLALSFDVRAPAGTITPTMATVTPVTGDIGESNPLAFGDGSQNAWANNRATMAFVSASGRSVAGVVIVASGQPAANAVVALEGDGVEIARVRSNLAGGYVFSGISPTVAGGVNLVSGAGYQSLGKVSTAPVAAVLNDSLFGDLNAAKTELQTIDEIVFSDRNADGVKQDNEPGVPGVEVELISGSGSQVGRVLTNALGQFRFVDLVPDSYRYAVGTLAGFLQIPNTNSLALLPAAEASPIVAPTSGTAIELTDSAFIDANGDSIRQVGELPASGHTISVVNADGVEVVTVPTDVNGKFVVRSGDVVGGLQPGAMYEFRIVLAPEETMFVSSPTMIVTSASGIASHLGPAHATLIPQAAVTARGLTLSTTPTIAKSNERVSRVSLYLDPIAASIAASNGAPIELARDLSAGASISDVSAEGWNCSLINTVLTCTPQAELATAKGVLTVSLATKSEPTQRITRRAQLGATMGGVAVSASAFFLAIILLYGVVRRWRQTFGIHGARAVS